MTTSWVHRINITKTVSVTPTVSSGIIYTAGDQVGGIMTLTDVVRPDSSTGIGTSELVEVTVLDGSKQDALLDIWLFKVSPTVTSVDNGPFAMTAANLAAQCIGVVSVGTAYKDAAAVSVCSTANLNKVVQVLSTATNPSTIYAIAVTSGTPTYNSTSALQFQFSFFVD